MISAPFVIESQIISFLVGGGCLKDETYVELQVAGQPSLRNTGACSETMQRQHLPVGYLHGRQAAIHIVNRSSEGWGHINVDDFRFE